MQWRRGLRFWSSASQRKSRRDYVTSPKHTRTSERACSCFQSGNRPLQGEGVSVADPPPRGIRFYFCLSQEAGLFFIDPSVSACSFRRISIVHRPLSCLLPSPSTYPLIVAARGTGRQRTRVAQCLACLGPPEIRGPQLCRNVLALFLRVAYKWLHMAASRSIPQTPPQSTSQIRVHVCIEVPKSPPPSPPKARNAALNYLVLVERQGTCHQPVGNSFRGGLLLLLKTHLTAAHLLFAISDNRSGRSRSRCSRRRCRERGTAWSA